MDKIHFKKLIKDIISQFSGYEIYLVGGSVRNYLLNKEILDLDFATNAPPPEIKKILNHFCENVYNIGEKFGTISGIMKVAEEKKIEIQITTYRSDTYNGISRHPQVKFEKSLLEDLKRRDFTINSMAFDGKKIVDLFSGQDDLKDKIIRFTGSPSERIKEDPLRMLRAIRFATQLNFQIEKDTLFFISQNHQELSRISGERIAQEMDKIMLSSQPSRGIRLLHTTGIYKTFLPLDLLFVDQPDDFHHKNVFEHTLLVVDKTPPDLVTRFAALLHDLGKMKTRALIKGKVHFYGHEAESAHLTSQILGKLKYPREFIEKVSFLVRYHLYAFSYGKEVNNWTDSAVRRLMRNFDTSLPNFLSLVKADITSSSPLRVNKNLQSIADLEHRIMEIRKKEEVEKIEVLLNGNEIMELLNIPPSPRVGKIKNYVFQKQLDLGPTYTREEAIKDVTIKFRDNL